MEPDNDHNNDVVNLIAAAEKQMASEGYQQLTPYSALITNTLLLAIAKCVYAHTDRERL